jgi:hypothetical protein
MMKLEDGGGNGTDKVTKKKGSYGTTIVTETVKSGTWTSIINKTYSSDGNLGLQQLKTTYKKGNTVYTSSDTKQYVNGKVAHQSSDDITTIKTANKTIITTKSTESDSVKRSKSSLDSTCTIIVSDSKVTKNYKGTLTFKNDFGERVSDINSTTEYTKNKIIINLSTTTKRYKSSGGYIGQNVLQSQATITQNPKKGTMNVSWNVKKDGKSINKGNKNVKADPSKFSNNTIGVDINILKQDANTPTVVGILSDSVAVTMMTACNA